MFELRNWALVAVALFVGAVRADEPQKTKKGAKLLAQEGAIEVVLLRHKAIRDDLKLDDKTSHKIRDFSAKQWKKAQKVHELSKDKAEEKWNEMAKENETFLKETLSKE